MTISIKKILLLSLFLFNQILPIHLIKPEQAQAIAHEIITCIDKSPAKKGYIDAKNIEPLLKLMQNIFEENKVRFSDYGLSSIIQIIHHERINTPRGAMTPYVYAKAINPLCAKVFELLIFKEELPYHSMWGEGVAWVQIQCDIPGFNPNISVTVKMDKAPHFVTFSLLELFIAYAVSGMIPVEMLDVFLEKGASLDDVITNQITHASEPSWKILMYAAQELEKKAAEADKDSLSCDEQDLMEYALNSASENIAATAKVIKKHAQKRGDQKVLKALASL